MVALVFLAQVDDLVDAQRNLGIEGFLILILSLALLASFLQIRSLIGVVQKNQSLQEDANKTAAKNAEAGWKVATSLERTTINDERRIVALETMGASIQAMLPMLQAINPMLVDLKAMGLEHRTFMESQQKAHEKTEEKQTKKLDHLITLAGSGVKSEVEGVLALINTMKAENDRRYEENAQRHASYDEKLNQILDRVVVLASGVVTLDTSPVEAVDSEPEAAPAPEVNPT